MNGLTVDSGAGILTGAAGPIACRIGRSGTCPASTKREGDGCTPLGTWPLRGALFRRDRFTPPSALALPWRWIAQDDGWSDDPADPAYNRPVRHPHSFSAERLWRADGLYDAIVVIGHNDRPPRPGAGSAIFLHLAGETQTEGCVAIDRGAMAALLPELRPGMPLTIL